MKTSYSEAFKRDDMALVSPPQVDNYRGFIFACFDPAADSLYDYLAGAREYLDLVADQSELGMKIVSGQQAYSARANWKLLVENSYDGYHGLPTHQRYFSFLSDIGVDLKGRDVAAPSYQKAVDLGNGHAVVEYQSAWGRPIARLGCAIRRASQGSFRGSPAAIRGSRFGAGAGAAYLRDQP